LISHRRPWFEETQQQKPRLLQLLLATASCFGFLGTIQFDLNNFEKTTIQCQYKVNTKSIQSQYQIHPMQQWHKRKENLPHSNKHVVSDKIDCMGGVLEQSLFCGHWQVLQSPLLGCTLAPSHGLGQVQPHVWGSRTACLSVQTSAADLPVVGSTGHTQAQLSPRTIGASHTGLSAAHWHLEQSADGSLLSVSHFATMSGLQVTAHCGEALWTWNSVKEDASHLQEQVA
jgi:hypothetical protein